MTVVGSFRCHWCQRKLSRVEWHHSVAERDCCEDCYHDPGSNYRRVYGKSASARLEAQEVKRARGSPVRVSSRRPDED